MISSHHIETTVNNKDLEKKIQQRLSGKKLAKSNRINRNERESSTLKLIHTSVNENQWGSVASEQSSELDNNIEEPSQSIEEEEDRPRPSQYYYDNSDEASLSGDEARIDEFHVSAEAEDSEEEVSDKSGEEDVRLKDRRAAKRAKTNLQDRSFETEGTIYVDWLAAKK
jgi:hypothetical protein